MASNYTSNCTLINGTALNCTTVFNTKLTNTSLQVVNRPGFVALVQIIGMFICMSLAFIVYLCYDAVRRRNSQRLLQKLPRSNFLHDDQLSLRAKIIIFNGNNSARGELTLNTKNLVPDKKLAHFGWDSRSATSYKNNIVLMMSAFATVALKDPKKPKSIREIVGEIKRSSQFLQHSTWCEEFITLCEKAMYSPDECTKEEYKKGIKCLNMMRAKEVAAT